MEYKRIATSSLKGIGATEQLCNRNWVYEFSGDAATLYVFKKVWFDKKEIEAKYSDITCCLNDVLGL